MLTFYKKRHPKNPVYLTVGTPVQFEDLGMGYGYFQTSDATIIEKLNALIAEHKGGVETSSQVEYDAALKKKPDSAKFNGSLIREQQTAGLVLPDLASLVASAEAAKSAKENAEVAETTFRAAIAAATPPATPEPKLGKRKI